MTPGFFTRGGKPALSLQAIGPDGSRPFEAVIDTGFTGELTFPPDWIEEPGLLSPRRIRSQRNRRHRTVAGHACLTVISTSVFLSLGIGQGLSEPSNGERRHGPRSGSSRASAWARPVRGAGATGAVPTAVGILLPSSPNGRYRSGRGITDNRHVRPSSLSVSRSFSYASTS